MPKSKEELKVQVGVFNEILSTFCNKEYTKTAKLMKVVDVCSLIEYIDESVGTDSALSVEKLHIESIRT